ncbi:MAG: hypothetical protein ACUVQ1_05815 [Candidatus Kapaibacteriales bacterium]
MKFTPTQKFFIALWFIGIIVWIGGSIVRTTIAYDLFEAQKKLTLRTYYTNNDALITTRHYAIGSIYTEVGFIIAFVSAIFLFPTLRRHFRKSGWLLLSYILFTLASISEFILLIFDVQLSLYIFSGARNLNYSAYEIQKYFQWRLQNLGFLIIYNWLAIFSIIFFISFSPLTMLKNED